MAEEVVDVADGLGDVLIHRNAGLRWRLRQFPLQDLRVVGCGPLSENRQVVWLEADVPVHGGADAIVARSDEGAQQVGVEAFPRHKIGDTA